MNNHQKVVLLDLWTDSNRGDNCLQAGLISMVRKKWPDCEVAGVFRFGINEFAAAQTEISETQSKLDKSFGGLRRTYYSASNHAKYTGFAHQLVSMYSFLELFIILFLAKLRLKSVLPKSHRDVVSVLTNADLVIWKGKNFRDYGGFKGLNRQSTLLIAGVIGRVLNNKLYCVNASVWHMRNPLERDLTKRVLKMCRAVTVRDRASEANLKMICGEDLPIFFAQDLSFFDLSANYQAMGKKRSAQIQPKYDLALTITEWGKGDEQKVYLNTILLTIEKLAQASVKRVAIVPQVTRASESNALMIQKILENSCAVEFEVLPGAPKIDELLNIYEMSSMVIGTRMHSCVFARSVGTPFIAIAYDAGPKWDILTEFWPKKFVFEYTSSSAEVAAAATELFKNKDMYIQESQARFEGLAAASYRNVSIINI
jgi:colanic acid/amylovoran biosynthesis protein